MDSRMQSTKSFLVLLRCGTFVGYMEFVSCVRRAQLSIDERCGELTKQFRLRRLLPGTPCLTSLSTL